MIWTVKYLPEVMDDLEELTNSDRKRVKKAIEERIIHGEPDKTGKTLRADLAGCRRIRVGNLRIVYRVNGEDIEVLVIAIGMRRDDEIYKAATKRIKKDEKKTKLK